VGTETTSSSLMDKGRRDLGLKSKPQKEERGTSFEVRRSEREGEGKK